MEIIFRCCEQEQTLSFVERWFNDKKEIIKKSWLSIQDSIDSRHDSITIMHDNVSDNILDFLEDTAQTNTQFIEVPPHTFQYNGHTVKLFEYLEEQIQNKNKWFYILEDDYLHVEGSLNVMRETQKEWNSFMISYDYPDRYRQFEPAYIFLLGNRHWRTVNSTCTTFAVNSETLKKHIHIFKEAAPTSNDLLYPQIYKQSPCIAPMPSLSTHLTKHHMSPLVDWQKRWNELKI